MASIKDLKVASFSHNPHDYFAKWGLKEKERFKGFLNIGINSKERFNAFDFDRFEFIDTEIAQKSIDGKVQKFHADVMAKIGVRGMNTEQLVGVITEHTSHRKTEHKLYMQGLRYNVGLLEQKLPPVMTIFLLHGNAPCNIASDLQEAFGWTTEMKKAFGVYGLNFTPNVVDLRKISNDEIQKKAGAAAAWCSVLKDVVNLTEQKIESIMKMCYYSSKDVSCYRDYIFVLMDYVKQFTKFSLSHLSDFEAKVIPNKEERVMEVMQTTYNRLINEGREEGWQKGRQEGRKEGRQEGREEGQKAKEKSVILNMLRKKIDISTIIECTGASKEQVLQIQKEL